MRIFAFVAHAFASTLLFPAYATSAENDGNQLRDGVRALGERLTREHNVPGLAVALIRNGEVEWIEGIGFADRESKRPVTQDTVFNVGSISKCVAAWGFMRLVENEKIQLDEPIETYISRWRLPNSTFSSDGVTLRRVLSHTAGLSLSGYPGFTDPSKLPSLERSLSGDTAGAGDVRLICMPGSRYQYSGGGYTVAQLMLEECSGDDFALHMQRHVLEPLEMRSSHFGWTGSASAATPYDENGEPIRPVRFTALAAAGLETTCADLSKFAAASLAGPTPVLSRDTVRLMQTKVEPGTETRTGGLGYQTMTFGPFTVVGHFGSNRGWEAAMVLRPESQDGLVMLTNGSNGQRVQRPIFAMWARSL